MNTRSEIVALALCAFGVLAFVSLSASARIVCNSDGDCWHTHGDYVYPQPIRLSVHPDNWRWGHGEHFVWKEHAGRGYWRDGNWVTF
ncbi:MAG TPA: hypothetical protein VJY34_19000 [Roseiarcus sp.]|nr:hypothetical protein [Roseiarcus sp.]